MTVMASSPIIPNEILATELVSAEHSLRHATAKLECNRMLRNIWYASPNLLEASHRLARIVSHACPFDGGASAYLLSEALVRAAAAYEDALMIAKRQEHYEQAYLSALARTAVEAVNWIAVAVWSDGRTEVWNPGPVPLLDWVKKRRPEKLGFIAPEHPLSEAQRKAAQLILTVLIFGDEHPEELVAFTKDL